MLLSRAGQFAFGLAQQRGRALPLFFCGQARVRAGLAAPGRENLDFCAAGAAGKVDLAIRSQI